MTANKFNAALITLGFATKHPKNGTLSKGQTVFASALGLSLSSVKRWANGAWPVPLHISALLNLMIDTRQTAKDLRP